MRSLFAAAVFYLFFGSVKCGSGRGTSIYGGCQDFTGIIRCESGDAILPTAKVGLWEADAAFFNSDDFVVGTNVASDGTYFLHACVYDNLVGMQLTMVQVYLEFRDACPNVDYSYTTYTRSGAFFDYIIAKNGHEAMIVE